MSIHGNRRVGCLRAERVYATCHDRLFGLIYSAFKNKTRVGPCSVSLIVGIITFPVKYATVKYMKYFVFFIWQKMWAPVSLLCGSSKFCHHARRYLISHTPRLIVRWNIKVYKILLQTLPPYSVPCINIFCVVSSPYSPMRAETQLSSLPYFPLMSHCLLIMNGITLRASALFDFESLEVADLLYLPNGLYSRYWIFNSLYWF